MPAGTPDPGLVTTIATAFEVEPRALAILAARAGRVVARVTTAGGTRLVKADASAGAFDREADAMARLRSLGLPVSDVLRCDPGPPSLLIATWTEGQPITACDPAPTLARVGAMLRAIHAQAAGPPFSGHPTIRAWIESWLRSLVPWWIATGRAPSDAAPLVDAWLATCGSILDSRRGSLILFDGRSDHILVEDRGDIHLIDVADLMAGDPAMDLAVLGLDDPELVAPVLAGYRPSVEGARSLASLIPLYTVLRAVSGAEWLARNGGERREIGRLLDEATRQADRFRSRDQHHP